MLARDADSSLGWRVAKIQTGTVFFLGTLAAVFVIAWVMQLGTLFSWDVAWLMEASKRFLAGGTYAKDFFENNPPLILYLYIPAVFLAKSFHLTTEIAFRIYFFSMVAVTLVINNHFLEKILANDIKLRRIVVTTFAVMVLIFPNYELGQRDQFVSLLVMPYILMLSCRLLDKPVSGTMATVVGLLAGLGFALKPVFMLIWLLMEGFFIYRKKSFSAAIRYETVAIIALVASYIGLVFYLHPDYLNTVMPFALRWCYITLRMPVTWLASNIPAVYSYFVFLFFAIQYPYSRYKPLISLLAMTLLGFLLAFMFQRTYWWYHEVPFYTYDVMLSLVLFYEFISRPSASSRQIILLAGFCAIFFDYLVQYVIRVPPVLFYNPLNYLLFFAGLFIFLCFFMQRGAGWRWMGRVVLAVTLGTLLFFYPFFMSNLTFYGHQKDDAALESLTHLINPFVANKTILALTTDMWLPNPHLANTLDASRFSCFWLVPGLYAPGYPNDTKHLLAREADRNFLINMVAQDINDKKPDYIFVDEKKHKMEFWTYVADSPEQNREYFPFDYLSAFSENPQFKAAFNHYHYWKTLEVNVPGRLATTLADMPQYQLAVYERNKG